MDSLPIIDLTQGIGPSVAEKIGQACHEIGFLLLAGHGIPRRAIDSLRRSVIEFFDQSEATKMTYCITQDNYRGYIPLGFFTPNASGDKADYYEGFKLHGEFQVTDEIARQCDLYGPNKWPQKPENLRAHVQVYWNACDRVTRLLLDALSHCMGLPFDTLQRNFDSPLTNMTLLHYPPGKEQVGIHPHKDTDALTILAPDPVGGLQVKSRKTGRWITVEAPEDTLIANIGDMLEIWSGGYFISTPHRVLNTRDAHRYSFPYFAVPRYDITVSPLIPTQPGFDREPMSVGEVSRMIWQSNWPDAASIDPRFDPATS